MKRQIFEKETLDHVEVMYCSEVIFLSAIAALVIYFHQKQKDTWVLQMMGKKRGHHDKVEVCEIQGRASFIWRARFCPGAPG